MKITHNKVGQNLNLSDAVKNDKSNAASKADKTSAVAGKDIRDLDALEKNDGGKSATRVDVSERALQAKKIKELALAAPDVNSEKVEKYKKMIADGTYKVDSQAVADRMVDEHLGMMAASNADE